MSFLCVCSDPTVTNGSDTIAPTQAELDFPVGTDPEVVTRYLTTARTRVRLVFSTYQSAPVVAEGMPEGFRFHIGVFDEAHVTAGIGERLLSFALLDDNLPIAKRIFYTATPRHHKVRGRGEGAEEIPVFSMDNEELYGPMAHELSFREAIRRGIITDYRIIITVITNRMLNAEVIEGGMVRLPSGKVVPAKVIAGQVALQRIADRFHLRKVFTFHQRVAGAQQFTDAHETLIGELLPEFALFHVNGAMSAGERERALTAFRDAHHAVMSNARCLSVGVNVPTVDGVVFQDRRGDMVDVVQASGRAMRRAEGKAFGYVVLPVYVEQGADETIEAALARSDFQLVWDVLQALREQDHLLAIEIGRMSLRGDDPGGDPDGDDGDIITIDGPAVDVEDLERAVGAICVDGLPRRYVTSPYPTWVEAPAAAQRLSPRPTSQKAYQKVYHQDPRLPSNPNIAYATVWAQKGGFPGFLGTETKQPVQDPYPTWEEASAAAQLLKPKPVGSVSYLKVYRQNPRLTSNPYVLYTKVWDKNGGWPGFLGTSTPRRGKRR